MRLFTPKQFDMRTLYENDDVDYRIEYLCLSCYNKIYIEQKTDNI